MDRLNEVYDALKWKKSDEYCSIKLDMDLELFRDAKKRITESLVTFQGYFDSMFKDVLSKGHTEDLKTDPDYIKVLTNQIGRSTEYTVHQQGERTETEHDLEDGTSKIKGIAYFEPHTPEQIIELLKIDTGKWRLDRYWSKQRAKGQWLVSALVSQVKQTQPEILKQVLDSLQLKYVPVKTQFLNTVFLDPTCMVLSLQDIHIGKKEITEAGSIEEAVKRCIQALVLKAFHSHRIEKIVFVLGGDLVNMDTFLGTTTAGTPVENSVEATAAFRMAYELMFWSINFLKQFCNELEVLYIPGNHSRLTEAHIAYSLSRHITDPNIKWNINYDEFKVVIFGNSMLCFEHGDRDIKKSYFYFSSMFPKEWGNAKFRICYTGHFHKERKVEYLTADELNGFTLRTLPSLTGTDAYHKQNKWVNNKRGGIAEIHSKTDGPISTFSHFE